jgi:hypothetical protein
MSDDDPSTKKYHQIVVPDHGLKPDTSGTSFLRTGTFPSLTDATKQPPGFRESLALARLAGDHHLKTGGSWHHVDGNRVETTTGRKVEVIVGSYVAHRGPGNSPGPNFSATWATNSYTQIGSRDIPIGWDPEASPLQAPDTVKADPVAGWVETLSYGYDGMPDGKVDNNPLVETNQANQPNVPSTTPGSNSHLSNGDVVAVTWAQRIFTYVGSPSKPVPFVYAETWADTYHSYSYYSGESRTYVGSDANPVPLVYAQTWAGATQTYVGDEGNPVPTVVARTDAGSVDTRIFAHSGDIVSWNHAPDGKFWQDALATTILTTSEAKADITVTNSAPLITTANQGALINTFTAALEIGVFNAAVELLTLNLGNQTTLSFPVDNTIKNITNNVNAIHAFLVDTIAQISVINDHISSDDTAMSMARLHIDTNYMVLNNLTMLGP